MMTLSEASGPSLAGSPLSMMALLAVLTLAPFALIMLTSFSKMAVVLSLLRSALGSQQAPPAMVMTGLAVVLSAHVMTPVFQQSFRAAEVIDWSPTQPGGFLANAAPVFEPLRAFLWKHGSDEERARFVELAQSLSTPTGPGQAAATDLSVMIPAFVITELREAFVMGFLVFLPFLVLDMVIANILLALGMQTLSPSQVSLPFKILLFVAIDGWGLLSRGLIEGYVAP